MATKRPADESPASSSQPPAKKPMTHFEHFKLGSIYSLEELDMKVLVFQNKKFSERIEQRKKVENELRKRIEQLENRQRTDDAVLMIVNRYWNQNLCYLYEDESNETTSFLTMLSTWDKQELEQRLGQRVEFSKRAIGKLLQAFDRLLQRNEKMHQAVTDKATREAQELLDASVKPADGESATNGEGEGETTKKQEGETEAETKEEREKEEDDSEKKKEKESDGEETKENLAELVKGEMSDLRQENRRMHNLVTQLHRRHHEHTLMISELQDKVTVAETESAELKNKVEDMEYEAEKAEQKIDRLERTLTETNNKLQYYTDTGATITLEGGKTVGGLSRARLDEILSDLEEHKELSSNRLMELEKLTAEHQEALKEIEKLKMDLQHLPESVILETTEYKCLQSQFSVLYNESMLIRNQLEEARNQLQLNKNTHLRQIEQMEIDELEGQKRLRTEMIQAEDNLAQMRKEYEMLRIDFEQAMAANDQNVTINREMRNLIQSLQNHNQQLRVESQRYKRRLRETQAEMAKLRQECGASGSVLPGMPGTLGASTGGSTGVSGDNGNSPDTKDSLTTIKEEPHDPSTSGLVLSPQGVKKEDPDGVPTIKKEEEDDGEGKGGQSRSTGGESEAIKELRAQLKKSQDGARELKLLLDMYKSAPKEQRDKVQREEALLNDLEVTGQAFEDMQEQNLRLLQQLREKDDANFKLMSERIKSNQIQKLLKEEKEVLDEQGLTLQSQVKAQNQVVRSLEDKERILQNSLAIIEKEQSLTQQALELHKRKAVESSQTAADLKLHLDKYQAQLKEAQIAVAEKTGALDQEVFKYKRVQEEVAKLQRKLERSKKIEAAGAADEVLLEEIKEYKEQLTCPSCKVNRKDAVLVKCFHVFCLECLRTRYDTRQRKCPKCNAGFGANDFHRLYLT
ncbi:hypothetical protein C0Q70_08176 [Pomacea canaliculata]|uniref:E3 ubiquitin protein ligase n=1 Tax=Pomacea canaliculata TaxID=400727 RepID=A0A2T7PH38_POMCA|nr:hypothetical protein C0Q70_08176 [Pomacea canaliculata]